MYASFFPRVPSAFGASLGKNGARFLVHVPGPYGPWIQAFSVGIHPPSANPSAEIVQCCWCMYLIFLAILVKQKRRGRSVRVGGSSFHGENSNERQKTRNFGFCILDFCFSIGCQNSVFDSKFLSPPGTKF